MTVNSGHHRSSDELDDLDLQIQEELANPTFAAAFHDATARADLVAALIRMRRNLRFTQAAVAGAMGTTQSAVSEFEAGDTDSRLSTVQRYARAIGCRIDFQLCDDHPQSGWLPLGQGVHYSWRDSGLTRAAVRGSASTPFRAGDILQALNEPTRNHVNVIHGLWSDRQSA